MDENSGTSCCNRRAILAFAGAGAFLAWTSSWAADGTKISQGAVHYQNTPKDGQDCRDCYHFVAPNACKLVAGRISPKGWCSVWVRTVA